MLKTAPSPAPCRTVCKAAGDTGCRQLLALRGGRRLRAGGTADRVRATEIRLRTVEEFRDSAATATPVAAGRTTVPSQPMVYTAGCSRWASSTTRSTGISQHAPDGLRAGPRHEPCTELAAHDPPAVAAPRSRPAMTQRSNPDCPRPASHHSPRPRLSPTNAPHPAARRQWHPSERPPQASDTRLTGCVDLDSSRCSMCGSPSITGSCYLPPTSRRHGPQAISRSTSAPSPHTTTFGFPPPRLILPASDFSSKTAGLRWFSTYSRSGGASPVSASRDQWPSRRPDPFMSLSDGGKSMCSTTRRSRLGRWPGGR